MTARSLQIGAAITSGCQGFVPGHWRADAPTGTPVAEPPKPEHGDEPDTVSEHDHRLRDPRTAANLAAKADALAPRRWTPPGERA